MNELALESFISSCDNMMIAEEGLGYKMMRKLQTNKLSIANQFAQQKSYCEKRIKECTDDMLCDEFISILTKRKAGIQRKINGKEISKKSQLEKFISLYDLYISKAKSLKQTFMR